MTDKLNLVQFFHFWSFLLIKILINSFFLFPRPFVRWVDKKFDGNSTCDGSEWAQKYSCEDLVLKNSHYIFTTLEISLNNIYFLIIGECNNLVRVANRNQLRSMLHYKNVQLAPLYVIITRNLCTKEKKCWPDKEEGDR